ncbi:hypothetical protein G5V59_04260 [Nocardioides sp. W3-2-3]|uniref:hypothetical protein n=1 Tax=Nocardioides convexus TaxID=2712224 RepID=UPI0024182840|nr:hypothetical protein [Nocardioides convexus]NGZ99802.1 hypothetical protein [Nocardioides convexus]
MTTMRPPARTLLLAVLAAACLALGLLPGTSPSQAAGSAPRILLDTDPLYSGPVVGYHYTAKPDYSTGSWPAGTTLHYQWFRADKQADPSTMVPVPGATSARYTMSAADHWHRMRVRVQAWRGDTVVAESFSRLHQLHPVPDEGAGGDRPGDRGAVHEGDPRAVDLGLDGLGGLAPQHEADRRRRRPHLPGPPGRCRHVDLRAGHGDPPVPRAQPHQGDRPPVERAQGQRCLPAGALGHPLGRQWRLPRQGPGSGSARSPAPGPTTSRHRARPGCAASSGSTTARGWSRPCVSTRASAWSPSPACAAAPTRSG